MSRIAIVGIIPIIVALMAITVIIGCLVDAKIPQTGDYVRATSASSLGLVSVDGSVTDIGNGFICLNSNHAGVSTSKNGSLTTIWATPRDICIGISTISQLFWLNESGNALVQMEKTSSSAKEVEQPVDFPNVTVLDKRPQPENDNEIKWTPVI